MQGWSELIEESSPPLMLIFAAFVCVGGLFAFMYFVTNEGAWSDFWSWVLRRRRSGPIQMASNGALSGTLTIHDLETEMWDEPTIVRRVNRPRFVDIPRPRRERAYRPRPNIAPLYAPAPLLRLPGPRVIDVDASLLDELLEQPMVVAEPVVVIDERNATDDTPLDVNGFPALRLSHIARVDNVLVAGPKGSGKTTILRTILTTRTNEEMIAIDPHASPGKWPCKVIGAGLNWGAIGRGLEKMRIDMGYRFRQLARGEIKEGQFPRRSYVGDEFLSIAGELDGKEGRENAGKALISRLTQGRKVGECVLIASQNDTVEALGIKGNADLKGCFDYIIFLGSLVSTRADFHGCPRDMIGEASKAERPGVVWNTNNNTWFMLVYDIPVVKEGEVLSDEMVIENDSPANESKEGLRVLVDIAQQYFEEREKPIDEPEDVPEERSEFDPALLVRAAMYMASNPEPSQRELAKHLFGKNGGRWNTRAGLIIGEVRRLERKASNAEDSTAE